MTYNVWSREDIVLYRRMQAIGRLVEKHSPDVIFFQVEIQGSPDPI
jgi:tyrosyl-DNA phosphodiesterase 2